MEQIQQVKGLMQQMQSSQNPQAFVANMVAQNPNLQKIFQLARMSNGGLRGVAQFMAQQKGVNLNDVVNLLQN